LQILARGPATRAADSHASLKRLLLPEPAV
jgi:hypothetical protein